MTLQRRTPLVRTTFRKPTTVLPRTPRPAPRPQKRTPAETTARQLVAFRSTGICEVCGTSWATDWHHRRNRSAGGPWAASNGLHLCRPCHATITTHPAEAVAAGWTVPSWGDWATTPVRLWSGTVVLDDVGGSTPCRI